MVYSVKERVEMIKLFFRNNDSARTTATLFNERHPGKTVSAAYVVQLVDKFDATGSINTTCSISLFPTSVHFTLTAL